MGTEAGLKAQENRRKIHQKHLELWHLCWQRRKTTLLKCHRMCKIDIWGRGNWKQPWPQLIICIIFYNWHRRHVELVKQHKRETSNLAIFQHFLCCFLSAWFTSAPSVYFFFFFVCLLFPVLLTDICTGHLCSAVLEFVFFIFKKAPERFMASCLLQQATLPVLSAWIRLRLRFFLRCNNSISSNRTRLRADWYGHVVIRLLQWRWA